MDKSDREDAQDPTTAGVAADSELQSIDDEVTAEVVPGSEHADQVEPVIISNLPESGVAGGRGSGRADDELEPGAILRNRFEIVELVHSSGMSRVYKALDNRRHRSASDQVHVAIKMMRRELSPDFDSRLALEREAARTQQLSHPNIVNVFDFDHHDEQFFIVMEWLEGESLNAMLRRTSGRAIATDFAWRIVEGIASGLKHAHAHDVIHADINPSNVFITDTQDIKVLDFGVARLVNQQEEDSESDIVWATHSYASPEVLSGLAPVFEDDIFSLGCVGYRALTGRHPFGGRSSIVAKQEQLEPEAIPGLPDPYWQVLRQSLALERADRPSSANAFFVDRSAAVVRAPRQPRFPVPLIAAMVLAAAVSAAGYWWFQDRADVSEPAAVESPALDEAVAVSAEPIPEPSPVEVLLDSASRAMETEQFVAPAGNSARDLYREVLTLEPGNALAATGLREISNTFVRRAEDALRAGDPEAAGVAISIADETDPENPALEIVKELLLAQANGALANARVAAIEGEVDRADEFLLQAERFSLLDAATIESVRTRIARTRQEQQLLDAVAAAEANIASGNLIAPGTDNAHAQLLTLQQSYGADARVLASIERLVERLLNRAAFATAAEQFPVAGELLNAAAEFGVLESDIASARTWLQEAIQLSSVSDTGGTDMVETATDPTEDTSAEFPTSQTDAEAAALQEDTLESDPAGGDPANAGTESILAVHEVPISELGIERFVPPRYPRGASGRGLAGSVDLRFDVNPDGTTSNIEAVWSEPQDTFVPSAIEAVRRWRFAERDDVITARVRLRFDPQEPE